VRAGEGDLQAGGQRGVEVEVVVGGADDLVDLREHGVHALRRRRRRGQEAQLLERAGMSWRGTHILRKTCGTRIADNGGGVSAVASHLRHKNLQTASRYIDRRGGTRVYTGFAVEWNALKRRTLEGLVEAFKPSQRDPVRGALRYALVFARRF